MFCDISQSGVRYESDSLYALVMIANEAKVGDHRPQTLPSGERRGVNDEAGKTAGCLDVWIDRLRELHKVVLLERRFWSHDQDGVRGVEVVFDHVGPLGSDSPALFDEQDTASHPARGLWGICSYRVTHCGVVKVEQAFRLTDLIVVAKRVGGRLVGTHCGALLTCGVEFGVTERLPRSSLAVGTEILQPGK